MGKRDRSSGSHPSNRQRPDPPDRREAPAPARKKNQRSEQRIAFHGRPRKRAPRTVPMRWIKAVIGVFLIPVSWVVTETFFGAFSRATLHHGFWATDEFWFFSLGVVLWTLWFVGSLWIMGEPRPLRVYVFGHELTHAVWVWIFGGRVAEFEVTRDGGSVVTDTDNVWVALSPYFYPIYSLVVLFIYGAISIFYDVAGSKETFLFVDPLQWLFLLLGITWAFHLSFTCWMIPKGQSDLTSQGTFFSLVFIYLMNILILAGFLVMVAPEVTWATFGRELLENTENLSAGIVSGVEALAEHAKSL